MEPTVEERLDSLEHDVVELAHLLSLVVDKLKQADPIWAKLVIEQNGGRRDHHAD